MRAKQQRGRKLPNPPARLLAKYSRRTLPLLGFDPLKLAVKSFDHAAGDASAQGNFSNVLRREPELFPDAGVDAAKSSCRLQSCCYVRIHSEKTLRNMKDRI
jgi:hypothetical protein